MVDVATARLLQRTLEKEAAVKGTVEDQDVKRQHALNELTSTSILLPKPKIITPAVMLPPTITAQE